MLITVVMVQVQAHTELYFIFNIEFVNNFILISSFNYYIIIYIRDNIIMVTCMAYWAYCAYTLATLSG